MAAKKKPVAKSAARVVKPSKPLKKSTAIAKPKRVAPKAKTSVSPKAPAKKTIPASKPAAVQKPEAAPDVSLGRPLVTQEEKLYMLFKDDFHARQIFEFLRVQTVKELEQFSPSQIVRILSKPLTTTVERIRRRLAELKRSLREDEDFAADFLHSGKQAARSSPLVDKG
jgi:hypothetical protein